MKLFVEMLSLMSINELNGRSDEHQPSQPHMAAHKWALLRAAASARSAPNRAAPQMKMKRVGPNNAPRHSRSSPLSAA